MDSNTESFINCHQNVSPLDTAKDQTRPGQKSHWVNTIEESTGQKSHCVSTKDDTQDEG